MYTKVITSRLRDKPQFLVQELIENKVVFLWEVKDNLNIKEEKLSK